MTNVGFGNLLGWLDREVVLARTAGMVAVVCVWCAFAGAAGEKSDRSRLYDEAQAYALTAECTQKEAMAKFMAVIEADPSHPDNDMVLLAVANLLRNGDLCRGICDPGAAVQVCQTIIDKFPPTRKSVVLAYITIGDTYLASGQREAARKAYDHIVRTDTSGAEWEGIREWLKMQADALAPVLVATALVPKSTPESIISLGELRTAYADQPAVLLEIDRVSRMLNDKITAPIIDDHMRQLLETAMSPAAADPPSPPLPEPVTPAPARATDSSGATSTSRQAMRPVGSDQAWGPASWIGAGLVTAGLIAVVVTAGAYLASLWRGPARKDQNGRGRICPPSQEASAGETP